MSEIGNQWQLLATNHESAAFVFLGRRGRSVRGTANQRAPYKGLQCPRSLSCLPTGCSMKRTRRKRKPPQDDVAQSAPPPASVPTSNGSPAQAQQQIDKQEGRLPAVDPPTPASHSPPASAATTEPVNVRKADADGSKVSVRRSLHGKGD